MSETQIPKFQTYLPAVARWGKSVIVEYYVLDPVSGDMIRKQVKCNRILKRISSRREQKTYLADMVQTINNKLAAGWNPLIQSDRAASYLRVTDAVDKFLAEKARELRPDSMRSYASFCRQLCAFVNATDPKLFVCSFTKTLAVRFLDDVYMLRKLSKRTYNNYLKYGRVFFSWCIQHDMIDDNPFQTVKPKQRTDKKRCLIPRRQRAAILDYFARTDPNICTVMRLVYQSLMRPKEIRLIRIGDLRLSERCIYIDEDVAKNHHARFASVTQDIIDGLLKMNLDRFAPGCYLFGREGHPSTNPVPAARWTKQWAKMRRELKLPNEMQLYSLRDTGISDMIKSGIDQLTVMQHADHSSLDITTIYARHADPNLADIIYNRAPDF